MWIRLTNYKLVSLIFFLLARYKTKSTQDSEKSKCCKASIVSCTSIWQLFLTFNIFRCCWLFWLLRYYWHVWSYWFLRACWLLWRNWLNWLTWFNWSWSWHLNFLEDMSDISIWICHSLHIFVTWNGSWFFRTWFRWFQWISILISPRSCILLAWLCLRNKWC